MIRVTLADREQLTAQALARLIDAEEDMHVTQVVQSADPLCTTEVARNLDVLILEPVGLSESGFGLIRRLRAMYPHISIVVLTTSTRQYHVVDALQAGAEAYVRKTDSVDDILAAIRAVHAGVAVLSKEGMGRLVDSYGRGSNSGPCLTTRQQQCLDGIVQGKTNQQIAYHLSLTEKTVKNYMGGLFAALGVQDRTGAAVQALRLGLVNDETLVCSQALEAVS